MIAQKLQKLQFAQGRCILYSSGRWRVILARSNSYLITQNLPQTQLLSQITEHSPVHRSSALVIFDAEYEFFEERQSVCLHRCFRLKVGLVQRRIFDAGVSRRIPIHENRIISLQDIDHKTRALHFNIYSQSFL